MNLSQIIDKLETARKLWWTMKDTSHDFCSALNGGIDDLIEYQATHDQDCTCRKGDRTEVKEENKIEL